MVEHYDAEYWEYQGPIGEIGGELNLWKFESHIRPSDTVLDFGCGGGFLLAQISCREKLGVEPSPVARAQAETLGLTVYPSAADVPDSSVDIVISNHALEHAERPLDELRELRRALKPDGRLVLVVPVDDWRPQRKPPEKDPDHHLYTWTPKLLRNLLADAGFDCRSCRVVNHAWHPKLLPLKRRLPGGAYRAVTWLVAVVKRRRQIIAVAVT